MSTDKAVGTAVSLYTLAGWLSILQAVVVVLPKVALDLFAEPLSLSGSGMVQLISGIQAIGSLLGIYVLIMFRRLLNERHSFHKVDMLITALICCNAAAAVLVAVELVLNTPVSAMSGLLIVSVLSSLISIVYAFRLLKLDTNLSGLLKPYVYSTMVAGLLGATLVLGEYGQAIYMVSLILLGMILIRADSEPEYL
jgi:hypothetical protein